MYYIMFYSKNPYNNEWDPMSSFWREYQLGSDVYVNFNRRDELMAHSMRFNYYVYVYCQPEVEQKVVIFQNKPSNVVKEWFIPKQTDETKFFEMVKDNILPMVEYYTTMNSVEELE